MIRDSRILEQMSYISAAIGTAGEKKKNISAELPFHFSKQYETGVGGKPSLKNLKKNHLFTHAMQRPFFQNQHTDTI